MSEAFVATEKDVARLPGWTVFASVLAHVALVGLGGYGALVLAARRPEPATTRPSGVGTIEIELPGMSAGTTLSEEVHVPEGSEPVPAGGATVPRIDTGHAGTGGERAGDRAVALEDREDPMTLSPDPMNRLDRSQQNRIQTANSRRAWEDRRSSKDPMELSFVQEGRGHVLERRPFAADPSRGVFASPAPDVRGGTPGDLFEQDDGEGPAAGAVQEGSLRDRPGRGLASRDVGRDHRKSASSARARPSVTEAAVSIESVRSGRPRDTVDANQEVSTLMRSLVHASVAGGLGARGRGGDLGGGNPGAGAASGSGSHASPLGKGPGEWFDYDTRDPNLMPYFRKLHEKIDPLWRNAFPKQAALDLKQGMVILEFVVKADGRVSVAWPPVRPSGIDEFDRNCAEAIRRSAPFPPIPPSLGQELRIRAPFVENNAVIK